MLQNTVQAVEGNKGEDLNVLMCLNISAELQPPPQGWTTPLVTMATTVLPSHRHEQIDQHFRHGTGRISLSHYCNVILTHHWFIQDHQHLATEWDRLLTNGTNLGHFFHIRFPLDFTS